MKMNTRTVKWRKATKEYDSTQPDNGGQDAFLHASAVERVGLGTPHEGQRVRSDLEQSRNGELAACSLQAV